MSEPAAIVDPPAAAPTASRRFDLDALRGLIMALMALDHASGFVAHRHSTEMWAGEWTRYEEVLPFVTRFVTHLCAPGFFLLMGCGMEMFASGRRRLGWSSGRILGHFVTRGLLLVLINQLLENPAWLLGFMFQNPGTTPEAVLPGGGGMPFIVTGVLTALGLGMAIAGMLLPLRWWAWAMVVLACIGLANGMLPLESRMQEQLAPWWRILLVPGQSGPLLVMYPVLPWLAALGSGVLLGRAIEAGTRTSRAFMAGLALLGAGLAIRALGGFGNIRAPRDGSVIEFLNMIKYPPALTFLAVTLGIDLVLLSVFARARGWVRSLGELLAAYGRVPLFFYLAHLYLYGGVSAIFFRAPVSMPAMVLVWLAGLIPLWFVCRWFAEFKASKPETSIWRVF